MTLTSILTHSKLLIPVATVALSIFGLQQIVKKTNTQGAHPGYHKQYMEEKVNEDGIIPFGLQNQWANWDKSKLGRRTGDDPFTSVDELGPFAVGGRTRALWVDPTNDQIILAGAISGGMWRSENGGQSWAPLDDHQISMMPSCIISSPFNSKIIYYGTGESRANSADVDGNGVFKSTDGGKTFTQLPSTANNENFTNVWDIAHSLDDANTLFVATHNRGVLKSTDAGATWQNVYSPSPVDRIICLPNGIVVLGKTYNGVVYSTENGNSGTWKTSSFNEGVGKTFGRVQLSSCKSFPNVVYAMLEGRGFSDPCAAFYKSSDSGKTFIKKSIPSTIGSGYNLYCQMLGAHPTDTNKVVAGGVNIAQSNDGGNNWTSLSTGHSDHHSFAPLNNSTTFLVGNDGGVYRYSWTSRNPTALNDGYQVTQFYAGSYAPSGVGTVGGTQDNGTHYQRGNMVGTKLYGGDGAYCFVSQQPDGKVAYLSTQNNGIRRVDNFNITTGAGFSTSIADPLFDSDGVDFINCYAMSEYDYNILFYRTNRGWYRTLDGGNQWEKMNNITRGGTKAIGIGYGSNPPVYFGGTGGQFFMIENAYTALPGEEKILKTSLASQVYSHTIKGIVVDPKNNYTVYVALNNFSSEDRVWKVTGLDQPNPTWTSVSGDLPENLPVNYMTTDPAQPGKDLFAGTDFGLYYSTDSGVTWTKEMKIPNVAVHEVKMRADRKLFIITHGRGIWYAPLKDIPMNNIGKIQSNSNFSFYPNPTTDFLTINTPFSGDLNLFDSKGKMVFNKTVGQGNSKITLPKLSAGIYFVNYSGRNQSMTRRLYIK